ncbi:hypothetical protein AKJ09_02643 [Labilithrix luteola]|uniref:Cytochrome c domain-containing protein n=1 Tax=Labilithrix luteola TaxID=1391654 RepID=A0A0K1PS70_9BACT|nr:hypothetical protein [Labilithrix luteola]AKU95979.1 hypothetical protein AKJ09_02643 [Labilithrix luteola]
MRRRTVVHGALLFAALAIGAGCAARDSENTDSAQPAIRELERRALGKAQAYVPDHYTLDDEARFATSKKARRELGWRVLGKVLKPVKVAEDALTAHSTTKTVPLFRTWLGGDEFSRMFAKLYGDLGEERRQMRAAPTKSELDAIFAWNETSLGASTEADYFARIAKVADQEGVDGLGGNARVSYSPGYIRHFLEDYAATAACDGKLESLEFATPPVSAENFTNCFSSEFPAEAAVIKASWRRNDELVDVGLPVHDTSADMLKQRVAGLLDNGGWPRSGVPLRKAGSEDAYTVKLEGGEGYSLVGLHVITKELRHWVWVTMWWSPNGDDDFGQDRPEEIRALGNPWGHYKMSVVTDFDERDPDPRGGFDGTLGDALAAVHGPRTWTSNAFIEKGDHNAQTNCMGCHQHAGDLKRPLEALINDESAFPDHGRVRVRAAFPADYSWAFATPASPDDKDRLQKVVVDRIRIYDQAENQGAHP